MCVSSMIGDHYRDKFSEPDYRWIYPAIQPFGPGGTQPNQTTPFVGVSKEEFDKLKVEVAEMKALLIRAKAYDERNNEPHCEIEEKMDLLRKVAKLVGIDLDDVIGKPVSPIGASAR